MRKTTAGGLIFGMVLNCFGADQMRIAQQKLVVLKKGERVYIRSYFSPDQDVLITMGKGEYNRQIDFTDARLIPSNLPMDKATDIKGIAFHKANDDCTPWKLNGTYIGGNHGCSDGRGAVSTNHGLGVSDLGSAWIDDAGNKFYIVKIVDTNRFWVLSENKSTNEIWKFERYIKGNSLKCCSSGKNLKLDADQMTQILPSCRIKEQKYLVDGRTPLAEMTPTSCEFLDMEEEYDIIAPDSLLSAIRKNTGKEFDFRDSTLNAVISNHIVYRFLPMGACVIDHRAKANRPFKLGYMGFIQSKNLLGGVFDNSVREYYIPKTLPFEKNGVQYDFRQTHSFEAKISLPARRPCLDFNEKEKNIEDPNNLPDRFIQFIGVKERDRCVRKIGYVLGYSLVEGMTRAGERARNALNALMLYSVKTYPSAVDEKINPVPAGKEFHCLAYRQYFDPAAYENATCVYWHKEGSAYVLYIDYHKSIDKDVIWLPGFLSGKKITTIEKTPSMELLTAGHVPSDGVVLSANAPYGYIILKLE